MKKTILTACGALTLLAYTSCKSGSTETKNNTGTTTESTTTNSTAKELLGKKWVNIEMAATFFILNEDGTGTSGDQSGENKCVWTINNNELCMKDNLDGAPLVCGEFTLNGSELKWSPMGMLMTFKAE